MYFLHEGVYMLHPQLLSFIGIDKANIFLLEISHN